MKVKRWPDGRRYRRLSASLASDHYRLFGVRSSRDPTLLAPHKISLWDTRLCVLGWDIDTVAMTISVPLEKLEFDDDVRALLRATVRDWNDLSINVLELLGMVVTALNFVTQSDARPS